MKDIKVTHSPRFEISVREDAETSFFENWDKFVAFKQQSKEEKTEYLQKFLKEQKRRSESLVCPVYRRTSGADAL